MWTTPWDCAKRSPVCPTFLFVLHVKNARASFSINSPEWKGYPQSVWITFPHIPQINYEPACFQQPVWISYKHLIEWWISISSYPPCLRISYPHSCSSSITSLFLSPSPPSLSTSGMQLSPFYTALSPLWISYPQGIRRLYRLIATRFIMKSGASSEAYPLIHRAYYYYGNIYIFKKR